MFAEAYLATQAIAQAKQVWPNGTIPKEILDQLSLPSKDMGVDGVLETRAGEFHAYQVKFRRARNSLSFKELSTFLAIADNVNKKLLIISRIHLHLISIFQRPRTWRLCAWSEKDQKSGQPSGCVVESPGRGVYFFPFHVVTIIFFLLL